MPGMEYPGQVAPGQLPLVVLVSPLLGVPGPGAFRVGGIRGVRAIARAAWRGVTGAPDRVRAPRPGPGRVEGE